MEIRRINQDRPIPVDIHPFEKAVLSQLDSYPEQPLKLFELVSGTGLQEDQVRRTVEWLKFKGMVDID